MTNITNAAELRDVYLHTFDVFATSPSEVTESVDGVGNVRFARELLGTLVTAGLVAESEGEDGIVFQTTPHTYDDIDRSEAETIIDQWLDIPTADSKESTMIDTKTKPAAKKAEATFHPCYCGCGENVPSKSFYRPGHDARHAGVIGRRVAETRDESHFNDLPSDLLVIKSKAIAAKALEKELAKAERAAAKAAGKAEPVLGIAKVGKNDVIARRHGDGTVEVQDKDGNWKSASKAATASFTEE